ncbi:MAG: DMT family transporter [Bacteroidetes bacterium]|nr:DMT family transporter [Bacteroidota bacterium]MBL0017851.1 DMT family transporter [Bacteroidota bacterium]
MTANTTRPALAWGLLLILSLIWGSSFILMLFGLKVFPPLQLALIRMAVAAVCLSPLVFLYIRKVSWRDVGILFAIGMAGNAVPAYLFAEAETQLPSAIVGVLNSMSPIFTLLLGWMFFKLRFPLVNGAGVLLGFVGATILALSGGVDAQQTTKLSYTLLVVGATVCYGISTNLIKYYFTGRNPIMIATMALSLVGWPSLIYLLAFTDFSQRFETQPGAMEAFGYIAILGAVGTAFGVALFNKLLQISSIIFATSVTYTIPLVALLWGVFLKEELTPWHAVGFAVILLGVWLANRK